MNTGKVFQFCNTCLHTGIHIRYIQLYHLITGPLTYVLHSSLHCNITIFFFLYFQTRIFK